MKGYTHKITNQGPAPIKPYDHKGLEAKWQKYWSSKKIYQAKDKGDKKFYALIEFPYPSGDGLHVGHPRPYIGMDVIARKRRMDGYNVLYPIGWDAFGLPTENYAIKTGIQPAVVTKKNTDTFRRQIKSLGVSFDWEREINTTDPAYYKWTQWIFLQFFKKGLAYKKKMTINWCPKDLTGLANEEVVNGCCERCGTPVEKRDKEQWMLAITKYAERLDKDLDNVDYLERIKIQQRNWIGKSEGAEIEFAVKGVSEKIKVFTTRPDTLFGVTYVVLAPENSLVNKLSEKITNKDEVDAYKAKINNESEKDRTDASKEKTGVELKGVVAINPVSNEEVPVWISDYVLADYGTGAVMAVPAHDERDFEFAIKFGLKIKQVIEPIRIDLSNPHVAGKDIIERKAVQAIITDPKTGKILCLKWKKQPWTTFIVGGVEGEEDIVEAARREVLEETGYKNLKFERILGGTVRSEFYAAHKDVNRVAFFNAIHFSLENDEKVEVSADEKDKHDPIWMEMKDINPMNIKCGELDIWMHRLKTGNDASTEAGTMQDSGKFIGQNSESIKKEITELAGGKWVTTFKLRDWVFSRQRYWGEPIPVIHCEKCGIVAVPEKDLPVKLPKVKNFQPTETGESPLAAISKWVNTKCPQCKGKATRETDTMPNWAGSSWYYLRYADPNNKKVFSAENKLKYWTPVDWYNGGMEHTTLHLLYSRFWHKFLFDLGLVPTSEPYMKRTSHGLILAQGGEKMSKSKGNVVNPDGIVSTVGADSLRLYEMFMGPFDQPIAWNTDNIAGVRRFIERVWKLQEKVNKKGDPAANKIIHKAIKKVGDDIEAMRFNTAVSTMMIALNDLEKFEGLSRSQYEIVLKLLAPFAPHVTDELWSILGNKKSIHISSWPAYDQLLVVESEVTIVLQINGKTRGSFTAAIDTDKAQLEKLAQEIPEAKKWIEGKSVKKIIVVPNKLVNIVVA